MKKKNPGKFSKEDRLKMTLDRLTLQLEEKNHQFDQSMKFSKDQIDRLSRASKHFQALSDTMRAENVELAEENSKKLKRLGDSFQAWLNTIDFL